LWRFDGVAWQQVGAEWNMPEMPAAQLGFDRDGMPWVLIGVRDDEVARELHFLAPGSLPLSFTDPHLACRKGLRAP